MLSARTTARLLCAVLLWWSPGCSGGDGNAALEAQVARARAHLAAGEQTQAIAAFEKALAIQEQFPTLLALAQLHATRAEWDEAESYLKRARALSPLSVDAQLGLADVATARGRWDEARALYVELSERLPLEPTPRLLLGALADTDERAGIAQRELSAWRKRAKALEASRELLVVEAALHRMLGEADKARGGLKQARNVPVQDVERATRLARLYLEQRQWAPARALLEGATQKAPRTRSLWLLLAAASVEAGAHEAARQAVKVADGLPHDREHAGAEGAVLRARIDLAGGRAAAARAQLEATLKGGGHDPDGEARLRYWLARSLIRLQQQAAARAQLARVPEQVGSHPAAQLALAELDASAGKPDLARARLAGLTARRLPVEAHLLLARLEHSAGNAPAAEQALRRGLEQHPRSSQLWLGLGKLLRSTDRAPRAAAAFDQVLREHPTHGEALGLRAQLASQEGDVTRATQLYRALLAREPRHVAALNNLALLLAHEPDGLAEALELAKTAQAERPEDGRIADTLGWIHHRRGERAQAERWLREAHRAAPHDPRVLYHLGAELIAGGETRAGLELLRKALARSAEFEGADEARALLANH